MYCYVYVKGTFKYVLFSLILSFVGYPGSRDNYLFGDYRPDGVSFESRL